MSLTKPVRRVSKTETRTLMPIGGRGTPSSAGSLARRRRKTRKTAEQAAFEKRR